jgi:soluble lytic murein transglycosylase-like protein
VVPEIDAPAKEGPSAAGRARSLVHALPGAIAWTLPSDARRRVGLLTILAVLSTAWAVALTARAVPPLAAATAGSLVEGPTVPACPFPAPLRGAFVAAARDTALPRALLYAVAKVESNLRQDARSAAGARGILQVMPATARTLALNPDEAGSNVLAGARYLRQMLDQFGTVQLALAAYNAGPTAVSRAGGAPSSGVLTYVANVNLVWHAHAGCS